MIPHGSPPATPASAPFRNICQACARERPVEHVHYFESIGVVILRFMRQNRGHLCLDCARYYFWEYTSNAFTLGWFGVVSAITNLIMIPQNIIRYARARARLKRRALELHSSLMRPVADPGTSACPRCGAVGSVRNKRQTFGMVKWLALGISAVVALAATCEGVFALVTPTDTALDTLQQGIFALIVLAFVGLLSLPFAVNVLAMQRMSRYHASTCASCQFTWLTLQHD